LVVDRPVDRKIRADLMSHVDLIEKFVDDRISAPEFETEYLKLVKNDQVTHGEPAFGIIDELFFYVDEYFDDPDFNEQEHSAAADQLKTHAARAFQKLVNLPPNTHS
jgi:hypothetical protein